jgi:hypothetical protein
VVGARRDEFTGKEERDMPYDPMFVFWVDVVKPTLFWKMIHITLKIHKVV